MHRAPVVRLSAFYFAYFAYVGALGPYISLYLESIGMSAARIGLLLASMQAMRIAAPNLWAALSDRLGRRAALVRLALALALIAWAGVIASTEYGVLLAVLAAFGFFTSAAMPLTESLTFAHLRDDFGRYGLIRMWGSIGFIAAVLGVGELLDRAPLASMTWAVAGFLALSLACALMISDARTIAPAAGAGPIAPLLRRPEVLALLGATFLMCVAHGPLYTFYSIYLAEHGYSKAAIGWLWSLGVVAEIAVFLAMPRIARRWPLRLIFAASFGCAVARFLLIGWGVDSWLVLVFAQLLHATTFGSYHAAALGLVNEYFSEGARSRGQALYMSVSFGAGGMAGGIASGLLWEGIGPALTFTLGSVCAAAGLALALRAGRRPVSTGPAQALTSG